jgi:hypothetical protein
MPQLAALIVQALKLLPMSDLRANFSAALPLLRHRHHDDRPVYWARPGALIG